MVRLFVSFPLGAVVANKVDLTSRRLVGEQKGRTFAEKQGLQYFECSAVRMCVLHVQMNICMHTCTQTPTTPTYKPTPTFPQY